MRVLDLVSEAMTGWEYMRGSGSIPTGGYILSLEFFHVVRACKANIGNFIYLWKTRILNLNKFSAFFVIFVMAYSGTFVTI